ncbi:FimV/HubP family polar landmark protein [Marinobacter mobilis]|uniref:FimV/HubP family polar landmark protein n=1 Tax=Marinobacter mobilis TaxID=488533 RepID=UPI0035C72C2C
MKVRKLAVALALAGGLGSGVAQALGLGEIELQSYLNEPLEADIGLTRSGGVSPSDVFVNLASEGAYRQVGIDRSYFLNKLKFDVTTAADGNLVVNVSTTEPVREPYLNFLLEVTWPSGRLMREYAVLIDPPVYAEDSGLTQQVQAPVVAPAPAPAPRQTVSAAPRVEAAPASSSGTGSPATFGPTGPADTLWAIASAVKPNSSVSNQQVMLAIQDLNPDAFIGGNINRLKRGQVLRIPTLEQVQQRSRAQATQEVSLQNEALAAPVARTVDAREETPEVAAEQTAPQVAAAVETGGDELKLMVADTTMDPAENDSGSAGGESTMSGGVDSGSSVVMEELDSTRRENEELSGRVEDLQAQVETLQRLLELKNTQLAEFEQSIEERAQAGLPSSADADVLADEAGEMTAGGEEAAVGAEAAADEGALAEDQSGVVEAITEEGIADGGTDEGVAPSDGEPELGQSAGMEPDVVAQDTMADDGLPAETGVMPDMAEDPEPAAEAVAPVAESKPEPVASPPVQPETAGKGFPQNIIDAIVNNPLYQIALGGGLVLFLLLMLLVARRNASKEKAFYDELNKESEGEDDTLVLATDESAEQTDEGDNPLEEVDVYIAYGRLDQAAHALEAAISKEPSRTDLRLKLLGVYADSEDRNSFEKQFGELEALEDDEAIAAAEALRSRLEEAEAAPSIDELESQLMSESFAAPTEQQEPAAEEAEPEHSEASELEFGDIDFESLDEDVKPSASEQAETAEEEGLTLAMEEPVAEATPEIQSETARDAEAPIEFDLSEEALPDLEDLPDIEDQVEPVADLNDDNLDLEFDIDTATDEEAAGVDLELGELDDSLGFDQDLSTEDEGAADLEEEFASLELGEESLEDLGGLAEEEPAASGEGETLADLGSSEELGVAEELSEEHALDESFLDDLDAELDKVAGEESEELQVAEDTLEGLELDVSDEDLALMGEVAGDGAADLEGPALDEELGLEDALGESAESEMDVPVAGEAVAEEESEALQSQGEAGQAPTVSGVPEIDEAALGEDDDFDFLAGTDEAATKLDLARAYIEMGDADGARDILEEVAIEGSDEQKVEAQDLLKSLS